MALAKFRAGTSEFLVLREEVAWGSIGDNDGVPSLSPMQV